jgi:hypothetical protein
MIAYYEILSVVLIVEFIISCLNYSLFVCLFSHSFFAEENVKSKWKNLRDAYIKHKKLTTGTSGQQAKRYKNWPWAPHMQFLDRTLEFRSSDSNVPNTETPLLGSETESEDIHVDVTTICEMGPPPSKKKTQHTKPDDLERVLQYFQKKQEQKQTCDAVDLLFLSYAKTFKTFSLRNQTIMKISLANLFAEAELRDADERSASRNSAIPSSSESGNSDTSSIDQPSPSSDLSDNLRCAYENAYIFLND